MLMKRLKATIKGISSYLPEQKLTNEELAQEFQEWDVAKIFQKTGISVRSISAPGECASDLGVAAARKLFETGICDPGDIDFLLFCSQSPDYFLPTTACLMQERLKLRTSCGALDFNLGCSGFVYGLSLAKGLIETGQLKNILLITSDTYTKFINSKDRGVRTIFGDGAAATLISAIDSDEEPIGPFVYGTDGRGADKLIVPAGGLRLPNNQETALEKNDGTGIYRSAQNLYMDGPEILNFTINEVPKTVKSFLNMSSIKMEEIDFFIFHQANSFMLECLRKKLKIPKEKFCMNLESYGNTVSATIPMAMELALKTGEIRPGDRLMLVGFGVGYSWGATVIRNFLSGSDL
jgi:3-oxoacyl-[acyl-carrier-protein] synthase III